MKYIIQDSVSYNPQDGTLRSSDQPDDVTTLTKTASSLLAVLLDDRGVVPRDYLIETVWGSQGLTGSYNNLNQYLSILRRAFRQYGLDDIILSMPRMGVQLNPALRVIQVFDEEDDTTSHEGAGEQRFADTADPAPSSETEALTSQRHAICSHQGLRLFFFYIVPGLFCLFSSVLILLYILHTFRSPGMPEISQLPVSECHVYALEDVKEKWKPALADDFSRVRTNLRLPCDEHNQFFFHYDSRIKSSGLGNTLLTQCTSRGDNPHGYCNNYFFYNWR
ncbi:winged helix-turn-helix domain-containing protein [Klebsiella sp. I138]|uniref:winged helix-turn-helix domain-containing protein n=1 Tax=Klebsiella sp. I138 TaxID=2755385 RepID=UPI003DA83CC3